ncbi:MAG: hypothetical protein PWP76_97 [Candidatus Diapherotrites archaeon]|nr:hypothetical protein [Candidatus Diapherotrites archaeon]MDN5366791.1 hypothetical protein [Candidatus Diapherotrites archaeon]
MEEAARRLIESMPEKLRKEHEKIISALKDAVAEGKSIVVFADTDADGASAEAWRIIAKKLGARDENIEVRHVDRSNVKFDRDAFYIVHDITLLPAHLQNVAAGAKIVNIDHHGPRLGEDESYDTVLNHPAVVAVANPFATEVDSPGKTKMSREDSSRLYAFNPSAQLVHIAHRVGANDMIYKLAAIGIVGDRAHQYSDVAREFAEAVARKTSATIEDLAKLAGLFELQENFPGKVTAEEIKADILAGLRENDLKSIPRSKKLRELLEKKEKVLEKYLERVKRGEYEKEELEVNGKPVRIILIHVDDDDAKEVQKIKSDLGSALLDKFSKDPTPTVVLAGQWEPGDVVNYRIGVNGAGQDIGLHAGEIARTLSSRFELPGGGHAAVGGSKIPHSEKERAMEHIKDVLKSIYGQH